MRAVRFHTVGAPQVLRVEQVPDPGAPTGDELLVRVEASSVNGTDLGLRRGDLRIATLGRLPFTPGFDVAGEVLACGPAVTAFAPGDRVLVHGATGGIGTFAVQLAVLAGAHVTAVAGAARLDLAAELGAYEVVDRHSRDVTTLGERFDVVLDAAGTLPFVPGLLTGDGVQVSVRPLSPDVLRAALRRAAPGRRGPRFTAVRTAARSQDLARLAALVDAGRLRAVLDHVHPLADAAGAHRRAEAGVRGKVVLDLR